MYTPGRIVESPCSRNTMLLMRKLVLCSYACNFWSTRAKLFKNSALESARQELQNETSFVKNDHHSTAKLLHFPWAPLFYHGERKCSCWWYYKSELAYQRESGKEERKELGMHGDVTHNHRTYEPCRNNSQKPNTITALLTFGADKHL